MNCIIVSKNGICYEIHLAPIQIKNLYAIQTFFPARELISQTYDINNQFLISLQR